MNGGPQEAKGKRGHLPELGGGSALGRGKDRNKGEEEKQERHRWALGRENGNTLRKLHHLIISLFSMN